MPDTCTAEYLSGEKSISQIREKQRQESGAYVKQPQTKVGKVKVKVKKAAKAAAAKAAKASD